MRLITIFFLTAILSIACKSKKVETYDYDASETAIENRSAERGTREGRTERKSRPSIEEVFAMDSNKDGKLSVDEVSSSPISKRFSDIDSNSDGFITKEEFENAPKPQRGERPRKRN